VTGRPERERPIIGVMGGGTAAPPVHDLAYDLGRRVAEAGAVLLCGGGGGVMAAAAAGARSAGGATVGILKAAAGSPPGHLDCAVFTGLGDGRNYVNVRTSDAVVALQGEAGTLSEIGFALKIGVPLVYLAAWEFLRDQPAFAAPWCATGEEAARKAFELLGWRPGMPYERPLLYPELPDQADRRRQLAGFLAGLGRP
jgi:uncharacterized protein (TIGR00725 family)